MTQEVPPTSDFLLRQGYGNGNAMETERGQTIQGGPKKVSHYQLSPLNRIKTRHYG